MNTKNAREFAEGGDRYTGPEVRLWVYALCDALDAANKDAERYRRLRNSPLADVRIVCVGKRSGAGLDHEVDAM